MPVGYACRQNLTCLGVVFLLITILCLNVNNTEEPHSVKVVLQKKTLLADA